MAVLRVVLFLGAAVATALPASANCLPPERPFLPADPEDARAYADLIRSDFENYISAVQNYFRCLDAERARAFTEAQEVSQDYGRFDGMVAE